MCAFGCQMHLLLSGSRATTPLYRGRNPNKGIGFAGPVQRCHECETVM